MPSKAFHEDQEDREPSERERAEKERAKRELAKRQKLQSYDEFEPITISELDCAFFSFFFYGHIDPHFPPKVKPSKCQIEELREKGLPEDMLSKMQHSMIMGHLVHISILLMIFTSTIEGVP